MKVTDYDVICLHLRVLYGISVKRPERKEDRQLLLSGGKVFGVSLENLPRQYLPEFGLVPSFLVDSCSSLSERVGSVGLFRKPGSLPRIKTLRVKLNRGESCLATATPYDVATIIKQFCRELPEPLFPSELHGALLRAQTLPDPLDRLSALQLLSCLLPARSCSSLHFLFNFLCKVTQSHLSRSVSLCLWLRFEQVSGDVRCSENLMTSSNLATVFTPCLLPPPNMAEMSEGRLALRVQVLRTFIENPHLFGVIPKTVMDRMQFFINYQFLMDACSRAGNPRVSTLKGSVMQFVKSTLWTQWKTKDRVAAHDQIHDSSGVGPRMKKNLSLDRFPNLQLIRACAQRGGESRDCEDVSDPNFKPRLTFWDSSKLCSAFAPTAEEELQLTKFRRSSSP